MSSSNKVEDLRNIGAMIARRLNEIGVYTEDELRSLGAAEAHRRIRQIHPDATLPICYYLYSFEAALENIHWDDLPEAIKRSLRHQLGEQGGCGTVATRRATP